MAKTILLNAKMRRTGVCGAAETLLVDRAAARRISAAGQMLLEAGCEVRGDAQTRAVDPRGRRRAKKTGRPNISTPSSPSRSSTAWTLRSSTSNATARITPTRSSPKTGAAAEKFLNEVDCAIVLHNASTQFADGGEFGFGAEIGIATGRLHARGPVGVEQLTTFKYRVRGSGQIGRRWRLGRPGRPRPTQAYARSLQQSIAARAGSRLRSACFRGGNNSRCTGRVMPSPRSRFPPCTRHAHRRVRRHVRSAAAAHLGACLLAMKRLELDRVWWLVTPGNPLKDSPAPRRWRSASGPPRHSRTIRASTSPESKRDQHALHLRDMAYLLRRCPGVRFVWVMGADNLRSFHRWQQWREIADLVPIAVVDRSDRACTQAPAAGQALARARLPERRQNPRRSQTAGVGLPPRPEVAAVLDRVARRPVIKAMPKHHRMGIGEQRPVETVTRPCLC